MVIRYFEDLGPSKEALVIHLMMKLLSQQYYEGSDIQFWISKDDFGCWQIWVDFVQLFCIKDEEKVRN